MIRAILFGVFFTGTTWATSPEIPAAKAINALGVDLLRAGSPGENQFFSPYSIQIALAMTAAGAEGETRKEMEKTLHYSDGDMNASFAAMSAGLDEIVHDAKPKTGAGDPIVLEVANRLFVQDGFTIRPTYLALLRQKYHAPPDAVDFSSDATSVARMINHWVAGRTRNHITDLIPDGALNSRTRLVLANAIYLNAPWENAFKKSDTSQKDFHLASREIVSVPTMSREDDFGYGKQGGFTAVSVPYLGSKLQLLILLPNRGVKLAPLEHRLSDRLLLKLAALPERNVDLELPKFKIESPSLDLRSALEKLGMRSAFGPGANFEGISPGNGSGSLYLGQIFHKAALSVGEKGTEAVAATAVVMDEKCVILPAPPPIEVHVNRPFLFAVQEKSTGACLFLGRVVDPR